MILQVNSLVAYSFGSTFTAEQKYSSRAAMESTTQLHLLELLRNVSSVTKHIALQAKMQGRRGLGARG
jgi:hypothetical protein